MTKTTKSLSQLIFTLHLLLSLPALAGTEINLNNYIKEIKTLKASFVQYNSDNSINSGVLYVSRPKYFRIDYYYPERIIINVNGPFITYYDVDLDQAMNVPIMKNSLISILLGNYTSSSYDFSYQENKAYMKINDEDGNTAKLHFSINPIAIEAIDILQDNNRIYFSLSDVKYNPKTDNKIFVTFS